MKKSILILLLFIGLGVKAQAQDTTPLFEGDSTAVIIHKDSRIDSLVKKQAEVNETAIKNSKRTGKGFRLMIISSKNRDEATAARTKIFSLFPELKPIMYHESPYFKVKAGAFEDRAEAEEYRKKVNPHFPRGVFIMTDIIELKPKKVLD